MSKIRELLDDIRKVRNDLVAQSNPHFQDLTNIIYKWENKLATEPGTCSCGRSPTGLCIGWHSLSEEQYKEIKKKDVIHPKAIDGFGE
jgi:hypothetical protein